MNEALAESRHLLSLTERSSFFRGTGDEVLTLIQKEKEDHD